MKPQLILFLTLSLLCTGAGAALAQTPDHMPPARETVCDNETGAAYGLCNAYCEAMDCDSPEPHASATACSKVGSHFERITGSDLPCNATCPCTAALSLFAAFVNGSATITECVSGGGMASLEGPDGFVSVNEDSCNQNGQPPVIVSTNEADFCRQVARDAAAAQDVVCVQPE